MRVSRWTLLAVVATLAGPAIPLSATVIAPNLSPGSQYQLIFVTRDGFIGYRQIAEYNTFVIDQAALSSSLPSGLDWHAVASTDAVDAVVNAPSTGLPVFNTAGQQVDPAGFGIYTGVLSLPVGYDQFGNAADVRVWTGSDADGTAADSRAMGSSSGASATGLSASSNGTWLQSDVNQSGVNSFPFYALSSPITVPVPEPTAFVLLGSGLLILGARRAPRPRPSGA